MVNPLRSGKLSKELGRIGIPLKTELSGPPLEDRGLHLSEDEGQGALVSTISITEVEMDAAIIAPEVTPAPHPQLNLRRDASTVVQTVVASQLDLVVEDTSGSTVARATFSSIPTSAAVISIPGGTITIPAFATETSLAATSSPGTEVSQLSSIQVPGSSSQIILSSPPSTPLPSSAGTQSYFPTSAPFPSVTSITNSTAIPSFATSSRLATGSRIPSPANSTQTSSSGTASRTSSRTRTTLSTLSTSRLSRTSNALITSTSTSTSNSPTSTSSGGGAGGLGSPTETSPGSPSTPSASPTEAAAAGNSSVTIPVVGGVVGGLAGLALLLVVVLFLLRWKRRRLQATGQLGGTESEAAPPGTSHSAVPMAQNSAAPWGAAAIAPLFRRIRPHSTQTTTTTETAPSERGFQKLGGRKLESVLVSGGDGYGDNGRGPGAGNLSGSSFYRDSQGTYGGPGSVRSSMNVGPGTPGRSAVPSGSYDPTIASSSRDVSQQNPIDKEFVTMRPGPARTPIHSPGFSTPRQTATPPPRATPEHGYTSSPSQLQRPDPLGRSHPSFDGSRGSRFAEDLRE